MQTRDYKQCAPGQYYHIYNRGNARGDVFLDADDYRFFLLRLRQNIKPNGTEGRFFRPLPPGSFSLIAYCLMPNHLHLLMRQNEEISTSKLMGKICTSYSKYFNQKYKRVGHIFQDQFKQVLVDDDRYIMFLSAYIHLNPVVAGLVSRPEQYPWSSYHEYMGSASTHLCEPEIILDRYGEGIKTSYADFIHENRLALEEKIPADIRMD